MFFADDLALAATNRTELERVLELWRQALEGAGLKISREKTETLRMNTTDAEPIQLESTTLPDVTQFKYLGSRIYADGDTSKEIQSRIGQAMQKWRSLTGVFCDNKIPQRLKGKLYRTVVRPVLMYGSETWAIKKADEDKLNAAEMKVLRWSIGKTRLDKVRNTETRDRLKVRCVSEKIQGARLRWAGHIERRDDEYCGKAVRRMQASGTRPKGRPKMRWEDKVKADRLSSLDYR